jgi:hypothetical protein
VVVDILEVLERVFIVERCIVHSNDSVRIARIFLRLIRIVNVVIVAASIAIVDVRLIGLIKITRTIRLICLLSDDYKNLLLV